MPNTAAMRTRVSQLVAHPSQVPGQACRVRLAPLRFRAVVLLAVICMIFASPMQAQSASITILVYDYVRLSPGTLREAEQHADKIVAKAGVSVNWLHCFAAKSLSADAKALCDTGCDGANSGPALYFRYQSAATPGICLHRGSGSHHRVLRHHRAHMASRLHRCRNSRRSRLCNGPRTRSSAAARCKSFLDWNHAVPMEQRSDAPGDLGHLRFHEGSAHPHSKPSPHPSQRAALRLTEIGLRSKTCCRADCESSNNVRTPSCLGSESRAVCRRFRQKEHPVWITRTTVCRPSDDGLHRAPIRAGPRRRACQKCCVGDSLRFAR